MKKLVGSLVSLIVLFAATNLFASVDPESIPENQRTPYGLYLTPQEAYDMKNASPDSVIFIDIRTRAELQYVGIAETIDANIPAYDFPEDDFYDWRGNDNSPHGSFRTVINRFFVPSVEKLLQQRGLDKSTPIILMCQSGGRVPIAARELHKAGFETVYTQVEGFEGIKAKDGDQKGKRVVNGWKNANLPWSYDLPREKMYFNFLP